MTAAMWAVVLSAVCHVESGGKPHTINVNDGGTPSYGECQVKLNTARQMGFTGTPGQLLKRDVNRAVALRYLKYQYTRYGSLPKAIAAYNSGSVRGEIRNTKYVEKVFRAVREGR